MEFSFFCDFKLKKLDVFHEKLVLNIYCRAYLTIKMLKKIKAVEKKQNVSFFVVYSILKTNFFDHA